tara:strand:+ start:69 stop:932 length:864 start_codon:yes stop_codon:yes gene_type:complete
MNQVILRDASGNTIFAGTRAELAGGIAGSVFTFVAVVFVLVRSNKIRIKNAKIAAIKKEEKKKEEAKEIDKFKKKCKKLIKKHKYALAIDRKKYLKKNQYGVEEDKGWALDYDFGKKKVTGIRYFIDEVIQEKIDVYGDFYDLYIDLDLENWIEDEINEVCDKVDSQGVSNKDIDSMDGIEYEQYCKTILENAGWEVEDTSTTGDQGVDLIASIENLRVCIQCKCFAKAVGNKAVQEIAAGMIYWKGTHSVVVAKSGFTKSAEALANSTNVILTSDKELKDLENLVL